MPTFQKQPPTLMKKEVLRDVQNNKRSKMINNQVGPTLLEGRPNADAIKICGTKRLTTECPSRHSCPPPFSSDGANEHLKFAHRKLESDSGKGRIQDNNAKYADSPQSRQLCYTRQQVPQKHVQVKESNMRRHPVVMPTHMPSMEKLSHGEPSVSNSIAKRGNGLLAVGRDNPEVTSEVPQSVDFKGADDQQRERFTRLQYFLGQCDESNQRDHIQMLLGLSPAELSMHAVELEKRAIQLTIEEGK
ncbi:hypothetical protein RJ640_020722 [Escallonia rubra]|uniref:Uncharacterized protein n=1 Tax=Escallonia rubra TaxID=112253 RepID=A0AA88S357_9ASTE|nr:hypothetical protein RJ640_020722 [Escallonia rubra]